MKLTTTDAADERYVRAMVFGDSGTGKTYSGLTLPIEGTTVILVERSPGPMRTKPYSVIRIESFADIGPLFAALRNPESCTDPELKKVIVGTKRLFIDSLSAISEACVKHIIEVDRKKLIKERSGDTKDKPDNVYEDLMQMEDWGLYRSRMLALVSAFCHLPYHVIFTALAAWHIDKGSGVTSKTVNLSGKAALECVAYFDLVFYMLNKPAEPGKPEKGVDRAFQTYADGLIVAKGDETLELLELPNWTSVVTKYLKGNKSGKPK